MSPPITHNNPRWQRLWRFICPYQFPGRNYASEFPKNFRHFTFVFPKTAAWKQIRECPYRTNILIYTTRRLTDWRTVTVNEWRNDVDNALYYGGSENKTFRREMQQQNHQLNRTVVYNSKLPSSTWPSRVQGDEERDVLLRRTVLNNFPVPQQQLAKGARE